MSNENKNETFAKLREEHRKAEMDILRRHWVPVLPSRMEDRGAALFARADFAMHPDGRRAARLPDGKNDQAPWRCQRKDYLGNLTFRYEWASDEGMKELGFLPIIPEIHYGKSSAEEPAGDEETVENTFDEGLVRSHWTVLTIELSGASLNSGVPGLPQWEGLNPVTQEALVGLYRAGYARGLAARPSKPQVPASAPPAPWDTSTNTKASAAVYAFATPGPEVTVGGPLRSRYPADPLPDEDALKRGVEALGLDWETFESIEISRTFGITLREAAPHPNPSEVPEGARGVRETLWALPDPDTGAVSVTSTWTIEEER